MGKNRESEESKLRGTLVDKSESEGAAEGYEVGLHEFTEAITDHYEAQMQVVKSAEQWLEKIKAAEIANALGIDFARDNDTFLGLYNEEKMREIVSNLFTSEELIEFDTEAIFEASETLNKLHLTNVPIKEGGVKGEFTITDKFSRMAEIMQRTAMMIGELQEESTSPE